MEKVDDRKMIGNGEVPSVRDEHVEFRYQFIRLVNNGERSNMNELFRYRDQFKLGSG